MLAQSFKSATDLGITEPQLSALQKTLVLLETGKLVHALINEDSFTSSTENFTGHFNMHCWNREHTCGTVACIGGTAELIGGVEFPFGSTVRPAALHDLFEPSAIKWRNWHAITPSQAATALRSYLTTGEARWDLAVA